MRLLLWSSKSPEADRNLWALTRLPPETGLGRKGRARKDKWRQVDENGNLPQKERRTNNDRNGTCTSRLVLQRKKMLCLMVKTAGDVQIFTKTEELVNKDMGGCRPEASGGSSGSIRAAPQPRARAELCMASRRPDWGSGSCLMTTRQWRSY